MSKTHYEIDARCLSMHRLIAEKIYRNPALFNKVKVTLTAWRRIVCVQSQPYLQEWELLVNKGCEACLAMAIEDSEHATALRQSSPFTGILTNRERFVFLREWKAKTASSDDNECGEIQKGVTP